MNEYCIILMTASTHEEARRIGQSLLKKRLIACMNIVPNLTSIYRWQGEICEETEVLTLMKSRKSLFPQIETEIKSLHSYEVPEIVMIDLSEGSEEYLHWIGDSVA